MTSKEWDPYLKFKIFIVVLVQMWKVCSCENYDFLFEGLLSNERVYLQNWFSNVRNYWIWKLLWYIIWSVHYIGRIAVITTSIIEKLGKIRYSWHCLIKLPVSRTFVVQIYSQSRTEELSLRLIRWNYKADGNQELRSLKQKSENYLHFDRKEYGVE